MKRKRYYAKRSGMGWWGVHDWLTKRFVCMCQRPFGIGEDAKTGYQYNMARRIARLLNADSGGGKHE